MEITRFENLMKIMKCQNCGEKPEIIYSLILNDGNAACRLCDSCCEKLHLELVTRDDRKKEFFLH